MTQKVSQGLIYLLMASFSVSSVSQVPCNSPEYRQFDFWLGQWQVLNPDGSLAGVNIIERKHGGCVIHEQYRTATGYSGESLNIYDSSTKLWHQTWVDNSGLLLVLQGQFSEGRMILQSPKQQSKTSVRHRITWSLTAEKNVHQLWETTDSSGQWTVAFDGLYQPKER
jgi:hypothetical protein